MNLRQIASQSSGRGPGSIPWTEARLITATQRSEFTWIWQERRMFGARSPSRARRFPLELLRGRDLSPQDLDPTGRAPGVSAAAMHDVDSRILDGQDQLLAGLHLERLLAVNGHGRHDSELLWSQGSIAMRSGASCDRR